MAMVEQLRERISGLVKESFSEFKPVWLKLIGAGALILAAAIPVLGVEIGLMSLMELGATNSHEPGPLVWVIAPVVLVLHIALIIGVVGLNLGFAKICLKYARKEPVSMIADLKSGLNLIVPAILTALIIAPVVFLGMIAFIVPGVYLILRLSLINVAISDGLGPIEAIKKSFRLTNNHVLEILAIYLLYQVSMWVMMFIPLVNLFALLFFALPFVNFFWAKYYVNLENGGENASVIANPSASSAAA